MQRPSCALLPTLQGLQRVMSKVHAQRALHIRIEGGNPSLNAPIEQQDLHDMLGNLIDNACKWARSQVRIEVDAAGSATADDDGPGIAEAQRALMCQRGQRLDEHTPGSGLGLAIVSELAELYGAELSLGVSPLGGLRARLSWGVSLA